MRWLMLIVFLAWTIPARADVAPSPLAAGGNLQLMSEASVRMRREHVTVKLYPAAEVVEAQFVLVNDGPTKSMQIGFPGAGVRTARYMAHEPLQNFSATVDGKSVATKPETVKHSFKTPVGERSYSDTWHVFDASLTKGKEVTIVVRYGVGTLKEYDDAEHADGGYVLETGKPWKGGIDQAIIDVVAMTGVDPASIEVKPSMPKQAARTKDGVTITYAKLEPTDNDNVLVRYRFDPQARAAAVDWNALVPKL